MSREPSRKPVVVAVVLAGFLSLGLAGVIHHEPWRDELEIWLIARDSGGPLELLRNMGTEGHPVLWYAVNFLLTRLTRDPLAMQLLNLAIGAAAAAFFFRTAPFGLAARLLFVFGYYLLYEFSIIARSYALGLLLIWLLCARLARRDGTLDRPAALIAALLANTNLFGTIAAAALVAAEVGALALAPRAARRERLVGRLVPWAIAGGGAALGFAHVLAQSLAIGQDHAGAYRPGYDLPWLLRALAAPAYGALPLPDPTTPHPWNSNLLRLLAHPWDPLVGACLAAILLAGAIAALRHRPRALSAFLLGLAPMVALTLFVWYGYNRHHGQPFLWFVACAWIAGGLRPDGRPGRGGRPRAAESVLVVLLALQAAAGAALWSLDLARPFSASRDAAALLSRPDLAKAIRVGSIDYAVEPIAAYVEGPIWYPDQQRFGTFMDWGPHRRIAPTERVLADAVSLLGSRGRDVVLILNRPPQGLALGDELELRPHARMRYVARAEGAIVPDENYWIYYLYDPARSAPPPPVDSPPRPADNPPGEGPG